MKIFTPYLIRAIYEWCLDNSNTPHVAVKLNGKSHLPEDIAASNGIASLNVGPGAVRNLKIDNHQAVFTARFKGKIFNVILAIEDIVMIYGKESGEGLSFASSRESPSSDESALRFQKKKSLPDIKAY